MESNSFQNFPRMAPLWTLLLALLTAGLYVPYWLYTRSRRLNRLCPQQPIPEIFIALCIGSFGVFIALAFQIPEGLQPDEILNLPELRYVVYIAMAVNVLQLIWALLFAHRLNLCSGARPDDPHYCRYSWLVLSHLLVVNIFYLQYKINQLASHTPQPRDTVGLM